jgi:hypothetical protein
VCELLSDVEKLQQEREFAKKMREKFSGVSGGQSQSAAPASGKYGGFGSKDVAQGYGPATLGGGGGAGGYDPYVAKAQAVLKEDPLPKVTKKVVRKQSSESSSNEGSDSSDSEDEKKKKKKKNVGLAMPKQSDRTIEQKAPVATQAPSQNLLDLMAESAPQ